MNTTFLIVLTSSHSDYKHIQQFLHHKCKRPLVPCNCQAQVSKIAAFLLHSLSIYNMKTQHVYNCFSKVLYHIQLMSCYYRQFDFPSRNMVKGHRINLINLKGLQSFACHILQVFYCLVPNIYFALRDKVLALSNNM